MVFDGTATRRPSGDERTPINAWRPISAWKRKQSIADRNLFDNFHSAVDGTEHLPTQMHVLQRFHLHLVSRRRTSANDQPAFVLHQGLSTGYILGKCASLYGRILRSLEQNGSRRFLHGKRFGVRRVA
jgi:hypothetical protein